MKTTPRLALVLLAAAPLSLLAGCANVGDTNPTSPEKMEEIRQKQSQERTSRTPPDTKSPSAPGR